MSEITKSINKDVRDGCISQNENWLLTLIDAGQHQQKQLEQRVQILEIELKNTNEKIELLLQKLGV